MASWCSSALLSSGAVTAVTNPTHVSFTASVDHAVIDGYELDILRPDGSVLQTLNLGKPVPDAGNLCTVDLNVQPVAFGLGYSVQVRAKAGSIASENAPSVNTFDRRPGKPGGPEIKGGA